MIDASRSNVDLLAFIYAKTMPAKINKPVCYNSISEFHSALALPKPMHPLFSIFEFTATKNNATPITIIPNFYLISYKNNFKGKLKYGQGYYDFDEGGMLFIAPNQLLTIDDDDCDCHSINVLIHPDFFWHNPLQKKINSFGFFSYATNEALHLSDRERQKIISVFDDIKEEVLHPIDEVSQDLIISYLDVLLNYSNRFYKRQFITRKILNNDVATNFDDLLNDYFNTDTSLLKGLPSVKYFSDKLNVSPGYLSDLLRASTGQNTQQQIHHKLIEKAKELLSTSDLTVAEVAYQLGFEQPQSFSKLFKKKTNVSALEFRQSIN